MIPQLHNLTGYENGFLNDLVSVTNAAGAALNLSPGLSGHIKTNYNASGYLLTFQPTGTLTDGTYYTNILNLSGVPGKAFYQIFQTGSYNTLINFGYVEIHKYL